MIEARQEDPVEGRCGDATQQVLQMLLAESRSVLAIDGQAPHAVRRCLAANGLAAGPGVDRQGPAGMVEVGREAVLTGVAVEAVQHGSNELDDRRLARTVRAVEDVQALGQGVEFQIGPGTEAIDS